MRRNCSLCQRTSTTDPEERDAVITDFDSEKPLATWKAVRLPDWEWEAYEKEDDELYFGRVRSPNTYGNWEYGYFTADQLRTAGAYRTDTDSDDIELFPDGGYRESSTQLQPYETELEALQEDNGGDH